MKLRIDQLGNHLRQGLAPVYLLAGDEPLLIQEAADQIRAAARGRGFASRELYHVDKGFDWNELLANANTMSLFGDQKLIELRFNAKPERDGQEALQRYLANPSPDNVLLLILPKLDASSQKAKWFTACDEAGIAIIVYPVDARELPRWLEHRLASAGLQVGADALQFLSDKVEGNLLAAMQEVEKLRLLYGAGALTLEQVQSAVTDNARYNVFDLIDTALSGDTVKALRMLNGLRGEGEEPLGLLFLLTREVRTLLAVGLALAQRQNPGQAMQQNGVWPKRQPLVQQALRRHTAASLQALLSQALAVDMAVKGRGDDLPWEGLTSLVQGLAQPALVTLR